jgi:predicted metalloprotease
VTVDIQTFWEDRFSESGRDYKETILVLFSDQTTTDCGVGSAATGPFYCSLDDQIYLDTSFFEELKNRFGAPGDFAQAYVIAHEFGHHVQDELGILDSTHSQMQADQANANELSIRLELQADCLAGVWANSIWKDPDNENVESITQADIQEGLDAAAAVGDDRIQEEVTGRVDRESWTHGSSEQRMRWFQAGFDRGTTESCDTFSATSL